MAPFPEADSLPHKTMGSESECVSIPHLDATCADLYLVKGKIVPKRLVYTLPFINWVGGKSLMEFVDVPIVQRTWGLERTPAPNSRYFFFSTCKRRGQACSLRWTEFYVRGVCQDPEIWTTGSLVVEHRTSRRVRKPYAHSPTKVVCTKVWTDAWDRSE
jgi:hypothetical protein